MLTRYLLDFTLIGAEWVLWLLVFLSVASVAVILERLIYFFSHGARADGELLEDLREGRFDAARARVEGKGGLLAATVQAGIAHEGKGPEAVEAVMASASAHAKGGYDRFMVFLGTLGSNAPFVGLFGTVLGIIRAFADLAGSSEGGANVVMAGISEALVATAVGIGVAIPAVVAFNYFSRWLKHLAGDTAAASQALLAGVRVHRREQGEG